MQAGQTPSEAGRLSAVTPMEGIPERALPYLPTTSRLARLARMPVWHPEMQLDADPTPGDAGVSSIPALGAPLEAYDMDVAAGEDDIIHRATDEVLLRSESASPEPGDHQVVPQVAGDAEGRPPVPGAGALI